VNFYQASRAATYVALAEKPAIVSGGTLYVKAACSEGIGSGRGEIACARAMAKGPDSLLEELRRDAPPEPPGGAQRAYVLAMAMQRANVKLVGPRLEILERFGIPCVDEVPDVERIVESPFHQIPVST